MQDMDSHIIIRHHYCSISIISVLLLLCALPSSLSEPPPPPSEYSECSNHPYECGRLPKLYYPFWGADRPSFCGGGDQFKLTCEYNYTSIQMGSQKFEVVDIDPTAYTMKLVPLGEGPDVCSQEFKFALDPPFRYNQSVNNITLVYNCLHEFSPDYWGKLNCGDDVVAVYLYVGEIDEVLKQYPQLHECGRIIEMPAEAFDGKRHSEDAAFGKGFKVSYSVSEECLLTCQGSNGTCGMSNDEFSCYCPDGSSALNCYQSHTGWKWKVKLSIGVTSVAVIVGLLLICIYCFTCKSSGWQVSSWLPIKINNQDIEAFLKNHGDLALKRYKFSDVKKMTNSFKLKLGQGGFGSVYKGMLLNGSNVAVKILNSSKGNGEEFINEVASISRTSHVNIVTLLGFCLEGPKKVLIYEFMSNGSLDNFICEKGHKKSPSLSWDNLYQIAIGIARGLEYLHRGCNTRILHFDIKPHNILLDENFCPKISDFGLAKLCPRKESTVSMSNARGTIGYIAPEVCNRHFGGVSHKSDVYSYGMMLLEIVGERDIDKAKAETSHPSSIYFPDWIYKKFENDSHLGVDEENEVIKRMTMVGLWCIQTIPNDRPTISRVVEMLVGSIDSLQMPPKPLLSSPVRSVVESSTTTN